MVVDAFASELENQGVSAEEAHEIAVKSYLSEPEAFSPKGLAKGNHPYPYITNYSHL